MTVRFTILILAVALSASSCARLPINVLCTIMLLFVFSVFGLDFNWIEPSAEEIRNLNAKGYKRQ
jgi:hypothetical protein